MNPADLSSLRSDPLAAAALAHLTAGKWRKARDAAKDLFKKDRVKYAPLLAAANLGLAEEMLGRGLLEEAATVLDYLKKNLPSASARVEELETRLGQSRASAGLSKGSPAGMLDAAWSMVSRPVPGTPPGDLTSAADRLVISPQLPPGADAPELRAEWAAVRQAVDATARGAWEEAKSALRAVPAASVFGSWRLFLRGVRCVHTGEPETARQCFTALPAGSAAARAAWAYRPACGLPPGPDQPPAAARATFPALLAGASPKAAAAIAEADALWRKHDLPGAFTTLVPGFGRTEFPTDAPGLAGTLTSLFLGNPFRKSAFSREDLDRLILWMEGRVKHRSGPAGPTPMEEKLIRLQLLRMEGFVMDGEEVLEHAERIVALDAGLHGADPLRAAAVWEMAAECLKNDDEPDFADRPPEARTRALRLCMELDPDHAPRILALAENLRLLEREKELSALLDAAAERLPDHPGILTAAGKAALRQGRPGAAALLRRAVRLDPGGTGAAEALFSSLRAEVSAEEGNGGGVSGRGFDPVLWNELESLARNVPSPLPDSEKALGLERLRWFVKLRRMLADPQSASSETARTAALSAAPSAFTGNLALAVLTQTRFSPEGADGRGGIPPLPPEPEAAWRDLYWAVHLLRWRLRTKKDPAWREALEDFLNAATPSLLTRRALSSPDAAKGVLAFARTLFSLLDQGDDDTGDTLPSRFILTVAKAVADPMVRALHYQADLASVLLPVSCRDYTLPCSCRLLAQVESAARAAGDSRSAALASSLIDRCGDIPPPPWTRLRPAKKAKPSVKKTAAAGKAAAKKAPAAVKKSPAQKTSPEKAAAKTSPEKASAGKAAAAKKSAVPGPAQTADSTPAAAAAAQPKPDGTPAAEAPGSMRQPDLFE